MTVVFRSNLGLYKASEELEKLVGPRKYWLHNRVGGEGWCVTWLRGDSGYRCNIEIDDPTMATFVLLKLGK